MPFINNLKRFFLNFIEIYFRLFHAYVLMFGQICYTTHPNFKVTLKNLYIKILNKNIKKTSNTLKKILGFL